MDILDDMGVSKLSANVFFLKVNYSLNFDKIYASPHTERIFLFSSGILAFSFRVSSQTHKITPLKPHTRPQTYCLLGLEASRGYFWWLLPEEQLNNILVSQFPLISHFLIKMLNVHLGIESQIHSRTLTIWDECWIRQTQGKQRAKEEKRKERKSSGFVRSWLNS